MEYIHHYASSLGGITEASDGEKLYMKTSEFRKAVWEIMLTIPFGPTSMVIAYEKRT